MSEEDRQRSLNAGYDAFLPKPIRMSELVDKIGSHLSLEWVYEAEEETESAPTDGELIAPPAQMLAELFELAQKGWIVEVREAIGRMEALETEYARFAGELRQDGEGV